MRDGIRQRYDEDGFVTGIRVFPDEQIRHFRECFNALEEQLGREVCRIGLMGKHRTERFIWEMAAGPVLLDVVQAIVGDDVLLLGSHFFCKYPGGPEEYFVAWHQDITYWGLEPPEAHSAWIAVDDSDIENGCMQVIPASHHLGQLPHGVSNRKGNLLSVDQEVPAEYVEEGKAVCLELRAGEISIHHGFLLHSSLPNQSGRRRCGLTVRFIPPHVRQAGENSTGTVYTPYLVRGEDRYHHFAKMHLPFPLPGRF
jgi:ectoine hydroxylase-related dioxygenase (phytanoyl-CoA dioxygenase family)